MKLILPEHLKEKPKKEPVEKRMTNEELLGVLFSRHKIHVAAEKTERLTPHFCIIIGIGDDEVAELVLSKEAMDKLVEMIGVKDA